jgi:hypothetical protein
MTSAVMCCSTLVNQSRLRFKEFLSILLLPVVVDCVRIAE